jgi:hypothetical protein
MLKVYIYEMHAGMLGTTEQFTHVSDKEMPLSCMEEHMYDHASSYQEQDEEGEWEEGDPEIWLAGIAITLSELEEYSGTLLCGSQTFQGLVEYLEKDGMVFPDKKLLANYS